MIQYIRKLRLLQRKTVFNVRKSVDMNVFMIYNINTESRTNKRKGGEIMIQNEFNYAYLRGFIAEYFGSNYNFSKFLGIGTTALYDRLKNRVPFTQREIDKVANYAIERRLTADEVSALFFTHKIRKTV